MPALSKPFYARAEVEEIVKMLRLHLYNRGRCCGAKAIRREMDRHGVRPLPSLTTINRIVSRHGLTHGRIGHDQPKKASSTTGLSNQRHLMDTVTEKSLKQAASGRLTNCLFDTYRKKGAK